MYAPGIDELFKRNTKNPILHYAQWPYTANAVFNPGATRYRDKVLLLVRVENRQGYSHLTVATSRDGRTQWTIHGTPSLRADPVAGEAEFGLEDPRIVWMPERGEYVITCVSFFKGVVGEPPGISLIATRDFDLFSRLSPPLMPSNKDGSLFPRRINNRYAILHRPIVEGRADIWVSFSPDMKHWGEHSPLIHARHRSWDANKIGLGPPPLETPEGWLIIYHGIRATASGAIYRCGLALLDLDSLTVIRRSRDWVLSPREPYERVGDVTNVVFPTGAIINDDGILMVYYGAADSVVGLAEAALTDVLDYLHLYGV